MSSLQQCAVLHAYPLVNAKRQHGGMRIVIDNRSVGEDDLRDTLAMVSEANAGATNPMIVAFTDEHLPFSLEGWQPPENTFPEFRGEWLTLSAAREMLAGGNYRLWCLNGSPGPALDPALRKTLCYTVASAAPGSTTDPAAIVGNPKVRTGVRAHADADPLFAQGIDWVAGWPLPAATAQAKSRRADSRVIALRLLQLVQTDADIGELEDLLKQDVGLAYKLLRFINSAVNALSVQVQSIRHAVMILGYERLTRWLGLLVVASSDDANQMPLMGISLRRGFFLERIGERLVADSNPEELFMTGMFSLLDRIFAQPFTELLKQVNLPDAVSEALLNDGGPYGSLLRLARAIEGDDASMIRNTIQMLGLKEADVNRALLLAIRDTDRVELH